MKRNKLRVIQIQGFRGILSAVFVVSCLIAGFIGFPTIMLTKGWNYLAQTTLAVPEICAFQGLILWGILAISYILINKKRKFLVAFDAPQTRTPKEIKDIINEIKSQSAELKREIEIENNHQNPLETQEIKIQNTINTQEQQNEEKTEEVV